MACKFLAIDSSLANTGIALGYISEDKTIMVTQIYLHESKKTRNKQIRASSDTIRRCREAFEFVHHHISQWNPNVIFAETPSGAQSSAAMKSYGITCQLIATTSPPAIEVTPIEVKVAASGTKTASKDWIINWAHDKFPALKWDKNKDGSLKNKNEHMADAIAIVHAGIKTNEFKRIHKFIG